MIIDTRLPSQLAAGGAPDYTRLLVRERWGVWGMLLRRYYNAAIRGTICNNGLDKSSDV